MKNGAVFFGSLGICIVDRLDQFERVSSCFSIRHYDNHVRNENSIKLRDRRNFMELFNAVGVGHLKNILVILSGYRPILCDANVDVQCCWKLTLLHVYR